MTLYDKIDQWLLSIFDSYNIPELWHNPVIFLVKLTIAFILTILVFQITYRLLISFIKRFARRTQFSWDDILVEQRFFNRLSYLAPAYAFSLMTPFVFSGYPFLVTPVLTILKIYTTIVVLLVGLSFLNSVALIYQQYPISKTRPIKGYLQVAKIIFYSLAVITIISFLIGQNPLVLIGGLGAFSAVLLLIFKDTLLGLVAGIQLTSNDMLRPGDWISFPKYDADGIVIDITLTTVKIQNFDKTYSTIPAYALFTESFKNWRGMSESGGRRIKRSIKIDMNSVKFCTAEMLAKFEQIHYITQYIRDKEKEINEYNLRHNINPAVVVNGRRQTNIGVFRAYLYYYLINHPKINHEMNVIVRHLQPAETGLPIEISAFSIEKDWDKYEMVQADIFDHILAIIPEFELRVFQNPSSTDIRLLTERKILA